MVISNEKTNPTAEEIRAAIKQVAPSKRVQADRLLYAVLPDIELAISEGTPHSSIIAVLKQKGLPISAKRLNELLATKKASGEASVQQQIQSDGGST